MDTSTLTEELLTFFKALADAQRLKIVGLLAQEAHTVEQLAALLGISPSTPPITFPNWPKPVWWKRAPMGIITSTSLKPIRWRQWRSGC